MGSVWQVEHQLHHPISVCQPLMQLGASTACHSPSWLIQEDHVPSQGTERKHTDPSIKISIIPLFYRKQLIS